MNSRSHRLSGGSWAVSFDGTEVIMGMELYPAFRSRVPGAPFAAEGRSLARDLQRLDRLATALGLRPLSAFADNRQPPDDFEPPDDFDGDPETYVELACGPWDEWFAAADGLRTAEGLLAAIRADPKRMGSAARAEGAVADLEELARRLRQAAARGVEFRLQVR
jgi:hypothetical protein